MKFNNGRGGHNGRRERLRLSPEQERAAHRLGTEWRAEWLAEKAKAAKTVTKQKEPAHPRVEADNAAQRAKFAEAIARAEFGRAYWDARRQPAAALPRGRLRR